MTMGRHSGGSRNPVRDRDDIQTVAAHAGVAAESMAWADRRDPSTGSGWHQDIGDSLPGEGIQIVGLSH